MPRFILRWLAAVFIVTPASVFAQNTFTIEQIMSAPFPDSLTASRTGGRLAWTLNQQGHRNIWVAEAPAFTARKLTSYDEDDGQALSELQFSADGNALVYVRGEGKNNAGQSPNPTSNPAGVEQSVWSIAWAGGEAKKLDAGQSPQISTQGLVAYIKNDELWLRNWTPLKSRNESWCADTVLARNGRPTAETCVHLFSATTTASSVSTIPLTNL